jgi:hypothetical protein
MHCPLHRTLISGCGEMTSASDYHIRYINAGVAEALPIASHPDSVNGAMCVAQLKTSKLPAPNSLTYQRTLNGRRRRNSNTSSGRRSCAP